MELSAQEQTLLAAFRSLDEHGQKELLRLASRQRLVQPGSAAPLTASSGQCKSRPDCRPEIASEPIFTE